MQTFLRIVIRWDLMKDVYRILGSGLARVTRSENIRRIAANDQG
jgi:hypothetical protein